MSDGKSRVQKNVGAGEGPPAPASSVSLVKKGWEKFTSSVPWREKILPALGWIGAAGVALVLGGLTVVLGIRVVIALFGDFWDRDGQGEEGGDGGGGGGQGPGDGSGD